MIDNSLLYLLWIQGEVVVMWLRKYILCYRKVDSRPRDDGGVDDEYTEQLAEIFAYTDAQAYRFAMEICNTDDVISLECAVRHCSY